MACKRNFAVFLTRASDFPAFGSVFQGSQALPQAWKTPGPTCETVFPAWKPPRQACKTVPPTGKTVFPCGKTISPHWKTISQVPKTGRNGVFSAKNRQKRQKSGVLMGKGRVFGRN